MVRYLTLLDSLSSLQTTAASILWLRTRSTRGQLQLPGSCPSRICYSPSAGATKRRPRSRPITAADAKTGPLIIMPLVKIAAVLNFYLYTEKISCGVLWRRSLTPVSVISQLSHMETHIVLEPVIGWTVMFMFAFSFMGSSSLMAGRSTRS